MESLIQYAKKPSLLSTKPTDLQKIDFYQYIFTISTLFLSVFRTKYVHKMKEMFFTVLCKWDKFVNKVISWEERDVIYQYSSKHLGQGT